MRNQGNYNLQITLNLKIVIYPKEEKSGTVKKGI